MWDSDLYSTSDWDADLLSGRAAPQGISEQITDMKQQMLGWILQAGQYEVESCLAKYTFRLQTYGFILSISLIFMGPCLMCEVSEAARRLAMYSSGEITELGS